MHPSIFLVARKLPATVTDRGVETQDIVIRGTLLGNGCRRVGLTQGHNVSEAVLLGNGGERSRLLDFRPRGIAASPLGSVRLTL